MKKFILTLGLFSLALIGSSQVVLNEIWYNPGTGDKEYIELYNPGANESLNCYSLLSYYNTGTTSGFIVINFPNNISLDPGEYSVLSSAMPFTYQGTSSHTQYAGTANDFAWTPAYLSANGGYIKNLQLSSGVYVETTIADYNNILRDLGNNAQPANFITLLYKNGILVNGLAVGVGNKTAVPAALKAMPNITIPGDGAGCESFPIIFSNMTDNQLEYMGTGIGANNGVHRTSDGRCGTWIKSASGSDDTPGLTNGPSIPVAGVITVGGQIHSELNVDASRTADYFIVNASTSTTAYPLILLLYSDNGSIPGQFDSEDEFLEQTDYPVQTATQQTNSFDLTGNLRNEGIVIVARSTAGCFETIMVIGNSNAPLPVKLKSFTAQRNHSEVELKWTTATEQNNRGFELQKLVCAGGWEKVAFVASKADDGNSTFDISYSYNDRNTTRGVTQYRLLQTDLDGQFKYSDVRSVRGESQAARMLVFPNPTNNGNVQVVFDEASGSRDVSLMDINGRTVKQWKNVTNNTLQIENLVSGMYNLRVINRQTGEQTIEKIIVSKK
jgi:hypothetical protein